MWTVGLPLNQHSASVGINAYYCPACAESPLLGCEACEGLRSGATDCVESGPGSMRIAIILWCLISALQTTRSRYSTSTNHHAAAEIEVSAGR